MHHQEKAAGQASTRLLSRFHAETAPKSAPVSWLREKMSGCVFGFKSAEYALHTPE